MRTPVKFDSPPVFRGSRAAFCLRVPGQSKRCTSVLFGTVSKHSFRPQATRHLLRPWLSKTATQFQNMRGAISPPLRRTWMISENGCNLIQVQQDRFLFNWKRTLDQNVYPSYEKVIGDFETYFESFMKFLDDVNVSRPVLRQFDLTYVNFISGFKRAESRWCEQHVCRPCPEYFCRSIPSRAGTLQLVYFILTSRWGRSPACCGSIRRE